MIDWLLMWYLCVFCGLLAAIHEPAAKKPVKNSRVSVWLADLIAYTYALDGYADPLFDTQPIDLDHAANTKARTRTRMV